MVSFPIWLVLGLYLSPATRDGIVLSLEAFSGPMNRSILGITVITSGNLVAAILLPHDVDASTMVCRRLYGHGLLWIALPTCLQDYWYTICMYSAPSVPRPVQAAVWARAVCETLSVVVAIRKMLSPSSSPESSWTVLRRFQAQMALCYLACCTVFHLSGLATVPGVAGSFGEACAVSIVWLSIVAILNEKCRVFMSSRLAMHTLKVPLGALRMPLDTAGVWGKPGQEVKGCDSSYFEGPSECSYSGSESSPERIGRQGKLKACRADSSCMSSAASELMNLSASHPQAEIADVVGYPLLSTYYGEHHRIGQDAIAYFSPAEREQFQLCVTSEGYLVASDGTLLSPQEETWGMFVMTMNGTILVHFDCASSGADARVVRHSSLVGGEAVVAAGLLKVSDGCILELSNESGHYAPPPSCLQIVLCRLALMGVRNLEQVKLQLVQRREDGLYL